MIGLDPRLVRKIEATNDTRLLGVWNALKLQLEKNQVGHDLLSEGLHKMPLSLWSLVLEKASSSKSIVCHDEGSKRPPLE